MKASRAFVLSLLVPTAPLAHGQKAENNPPKKLIEATVCRILDDPSGYNNKLVSVRGFVRANFEYSVLVDEQCPDDGIWFAFADGSGPPELAILIRGKGAPGGRDSKGRATPPLPVRLIKDSNFEELEHYWTLSAKGEACVDRPPSAFPPECTTYRVTATFTGRVDGVSKKAHAGHLKKSSRGAVGGEGFGHMGIFDAQIVVQSVENVVAVDESEIRKLQTRPR